MDRDVTPETRYAYRIKAINAGGLSERSDYLNANTPATPDLTDLGDITDLAKPKFPRGTIDGGTVSFRFELTQRKKVGLGLREQETNADLVVKDADGNVLRASRKEGTANEWITVTLRPGTYHVRLEAQEDGESTYMFRYGVEAAPNSPATGEPAITGTAQVGETLTADTSGIADPDGLDSATFSYQWVATDGGAELNIRGATGATYTLIPIDTARKFMVRVTFTDDAGNEETLISAATAAVTATEQQDRLASGSRTACGRPTGRAWASVPTRSTWPCRAGMIWDSRRAGVPGLSREAAAVATTASSFVRRRGAIGSNFSIYRPVPWSWDP